MLRAAVDHYTSRSHLAHRLSESSEEYTAIAVCLAGCSAFACHDRSPYGNAGEAKLKAALIRPCQVRNDVETILLVQPPEGTHAVNRPELLCQRSVNPGREVWFNECTPAEVSKLCCIPLRVLPEALKTVIIDKETE